MPDSTAEIPPENAPSADRTVTDLVRGVVHEAAPDELAFFDMICTSYAANPAAALDPRSRDELSGVGELAILAQLITTVLLEVVTHLASDGVENVLDAAKKHKWGFSRTRKRADPAVLDKPVELPVAPEVAREAQEKVRTLSVRLDIPTEVVEKANLSLYIALTGMNPDQPTAAVQEAQ